MPTIPDEHPVDRAVREHLEREAARIDPHLMLARVRANTVVEPSANLRHLTRRAWLRGAAIGTGGAVAAGLGLAFFMGGTGPVDPPQLSAKELIQEAKTAHETQIVDRCYDVVADWNLTPFQNRFPFRPIAKKGQLWTRGNQFTMETTFADGVPLKWGREKSGRVWILPRPDRVLVYDADELNEPLARFCELMSLRMVSTLAELLGGYDLQREPTGPNEAIRIEANPRKHSNNLSPRLSRVAIELDLKSKIVTKAILERWVHNEPVGTIEFNWKESATLDEKKYEFATHAAAKHQVIDGPRPPVVQPHPKFDPKFDPRVRFRDDWLKNWQHRGPGGR